MTVEERAKYYLERIEKAKDKLAEAKRIASHMSSLKMANTQKSPSLQHKNKIVAEIRRQYYAETSEELLKEASAQNFLSALDYLLQLLD